MNKAGSIPETSKPAAGPSRVSPVFQEAGCWGVTTDRKYYEFDNVNIKRSLRSTELYVRKDGSLVVRPQSKERILNEAACLDYIRSHTSIPVPKVICVFEDQDALYLITEHINGISMEDLQQEQRKIVEEELYKFRKILWGMTSRKVGGPTGIVITPDRISLSKDVDHNWTLHESESEQFVFCHNDYSQQNVIVDPKTLKINAIIDWEFAGFYPKFFDRPWFKRFGPAGALPGEDNDKAHVLSFLTAWSKDNNTPAQCSFDLDSEPLDCNRTSIHDIRKARAQATPV